MHACGIKTWPIVVQVHYDYTNTHAAVYLAISLYTQYTVSAVLMMHWQFTILMYSQSSGLIKKLIILLKTHAIIT